MLLSLARQPLPLDQTRALGGIQRDDRAGATDVGERLGVAHAAGDQERAGGERGAADTGVAMHQHWQLLGMRGLDEGDRLVQLLDRWRVKIGHQ